MKENKDESVRCGWDQSGEEDVVGKDGERNGTKNRGN